jgi:hypothetical protein
LFADSNDRDAVVDGAAQFAPTCAACGFDVPQTQPEIRVVLVDGGADEGLMVVDADLGDVAGVVADGDGAPDEWCQGGQPAPP